MWGIIDMQVTAESHESAPKEAEKQLEARHLTVIPTKGVIDIAITH